MMFISLSDMYKYRATISLFQIFINICILCIFILYIVLYIVFLFQISYLYKKLYCLLQIRCIFICNL